MERSIHEKEKEAIHAVLDRIIKAASNDVGENLMVEVSAYAVLMSAAKKRRELPDGSQPLH